MTALLRLTYDPGSEVLPAWTRTGALSTTVRQGAELRIQQADGSEARSFVVGSRRIWQADLAPDGTGSCRVGQREYSR